MDAESRLTNVDWFITNVCDQAKHCGFCYAPWNAFPPDADEETALKICDRIADLNIRNVTLCGGEPTLFPHVTKIVHQMYTDGIRIVFYSSITDAYDLNEVVNEIHTLSIPIDAVTPEIINRMRGSDQTEGVHRAVSLIQKTGHTRPRVKVGTVVTIQNVEDIENIFHYLEGTGIVDVWRLYQFSPYGIGKHNAKRYLISNDQFHSAVIRLKELAKHSHIQIAERDREDNSGYCRIMDSRGSFYRYEERYVPLNVTIFDEPDAILAGYDNIKNTRQKSWQE